VTLTLFVSSSIQSEELLNKEVSLPFHAAYKMIEEVLKIKLSCSPGIQEARYSSQIGSHCDFYSLMNVSHLICFITSNDSIIEGIYILIEGKEDNILLRHSSGGSRPFWVPQSRVASSLETSIGRIMAGDRDHLQKQIGILSRENLKLLSKEAAESDRADDLEANLETPRLFLESEVLT